MADTRFKQLSEEERAATLNNRRRSLEAELWQLEINKIGAAADEANEKRISEIESALAELDRLDPENK